MVELQRWPRARRPRSLEVLVVGKYQADSSRFMASDSMLVGSAGVAWGAKDMHEDGMPGALFGCGWKPGSVGMGIQISVGLISRFSSKHMTRCVGGPCLNELQVNELVLSNRVRLAASHSIPVLVPSAFDQAGRFWTRGQADPKLRKPALQCTRASRRLSCG